MAWHAQSLARNRFRIDPAQFLLNGTDAASLYGLADFEAAKGLTDRMGLIGSASDKDFTCEFPWDAGAASNFFAHQREQLLESGEFTPDELDRLSGRTVLFWMTSREPHPF